MKCLAGLSGGGLTSFGAYLNSSGCVDNSTLGELWGEYDARSRPWYTLAKERKRWTDVYVDDPTGELVISVAAPLFDDSGTALLGVVFADLDVHCISSELATLVENNETDATYVVGAYGSDYLVGASSGGTVNTSSVDGTAVQDRLSGADSPSNRISSSYQHLSQKFANGGSLSAMNQSTSIDTGNLFRGEAVIASQYYLDDSTGDIAWRLTSAFSEVTFYGYIWAPFCITAVVFSISSFLSVWAAWCQIRGVPEPMLSGLPTVVTCIFGLFVLWVVVVKTNTDHVISDALDDRAALLSELTTSLWRSKFWTSTVSSMSYQHGMLPLGESEAATNPQLDKHFSSLTKILQTRESYAGWENGDFVSATYPERQIHCRHSTTNNNLVSYNTTTDSSGATVRDALVANHGSFSTTERPWYITGRDCGRYNNSRYGKTCISATYLDRSTGDIILSLVQPFYDANYTFLGVLAADVMTEFTGTLAAVVESLPSNETELAIVERRGEVVAQSDGVSFRIDSDGNQAAVLITASSMDRMKEAGAALEAAHGNFVDAQNDTKFQVSETESTASCAKSNSWTDEQYNPISDKLSTWTQIVVIPRHVFFKPLDDGMSASFAALIFGCATILFLNVHIPSIEVNDAITSPSSITDSTEKNTDYDTSLELASVFALSVLNSKADEVTGGQEGDIGNCTVKEEDPAVLLSQDPESLSSNIEGDVDKFKRLYRFSWLQLQPTVATLKADPEKADYKLIERAAEYANLANQGFFVYTLVLTEQRYGRHSIHSKLFRWLNGWWAFGMRAIFILLFLLTEFLAQNSTEQCVLDITALMAISCFTAAWAFYQWVELNGGRLRASTWVHIIFLGLTWVALVLQQLEVVTILGFMRPWPLLLSSEALQSTLLVFSICVGDISAILSFAFFSICTAAIALFVLYKDRLDEGGTTINSFLDSFIATFILMESADNWESLVYNAYKVSKAGAIILFVVAIFGVFFLTSMILALLEESYTTNSDALLAKRKAQTRLTLTSSFVLASSTDPDAFQASIEGSSPHIASTGLVASSGSNTSIDSLGITKTQCMALLQAMNNDAREHREIGEFVFTYLDQDHSGRIEFIEFEKLLLLCRCCFELSQDRLLAHKSTIARAELMKVETHGKLADELSNKQRHLLEERVACQERTLANAHSNIDVYLKHLNQSFKIFACCETQWFNNIAVIVDIVYFWAMTLGATAWVGVGFNLVYCFMVSIQIHSMQSLVLFYNDPRGREYALQNKVNLGCTVVGMVGAILVILHKCGVDTNHARLWQAIQLAPLLRIFVTNALYRQIVRALLSGLEKIRPFMALFLIVFYIFSMLAYYAFSGLGIDDGEVFSEQLNFSTFGDSCLAMFQIFIGAGWSVVMAEAVQHTSHTFNWFFVFYRFVVGVLFAQLTVGILLATFQDARDTSATGEILQQFRNDLEVLPCDEQVAFVKGLGIPAQIILDYASTSTSIVDITPVVQPASQ